MPKAAAAFTPDALRFLRQLRANNRREWFAPRKEEFEELLRRPLLALCEQVADDLRSFAVEHVVPPAKAARRIYRDVRFSHDKTPYKTTVSALFPRAGLGKDGGAVYYFGVSPEGVRIAAGLYNPGPAELAAVRADIDRDPAGFSRLLAAGPVAKLLGPCQGERLVKVPKPFAADHPAAELLRHKQWYLATLLEAEAATRPGLRKAIVDRFRAATPIVDRLNGAILAAVHQEVEDRPVRPVPMF
jgi:uncharacterized protein (TIGR02453 family)